MKSKKGLLLALTIASGIMTSATYADTVSNHSLSFSFLDDPVVFGDSYSVSPFSFSREFDPTFSGFYNLTGQDQLLFNSDPEGGIGFVSSNATTNITSLDISATSQLFIALNDGEVFSYTPASDRSVTTYSFDGDGITGGSIYSFAGEVGISDIRYTTTSAAPEPSEWVLMFAGLAVIGSMLRSRPKEALQL